MPLEIDKRRYIFRIKEIWFSDYPYDISGYDQIIFRACKNKVNIEGFKCIEFETLVIDLRNSLDTIWENMDKKSCRYSIKRAIREGIKIRLNQDYEEFYKMNLSFRKRKGLSSEVEKLEIMKKYGTLFTAEVNGEIIAGQLYLEDENNIRWLLGASKRLEVDRHKTILIGCANRLIIWEAIKYAKEKGIKEFDLGGYYTGEDKDNPKYAINFFKQGFGGKLTTHYIYQKDSKFYRIARKIFRLIKKEADA